MKTIPNNIDRTDFIITNIARSISISLILFILVFGVYVLIKSEYATLEYNGTNTTIDSIVFVVTFAFNHTTDFHWILFISVMLSLFLMVDYERVVQYKISTWIIYLIVSLVVIAGMFSNTTSVLDASTLLNKVLYLINTDVLKTDSYVAKAINSAFIIYSATFALSVVAFFVNITYPIWKIYYCLVKRSTSTVALKLQKHDNE